MIILDGRRRKHAMADNERSRPWARPQAAPIAPTFARRHCGIAVRFGDPDVLRTCQTCTPIIQLLQPAPEIHSVESILIR